MLNIEVSEDLQKHLEVIAGWHGEPTTVAVLEKLVADEMQKLKPVLRLKSSLQKRIEQLETARNPSSAINDSVLDSYSSKEKTAFLNGLKDAINVKDYNTLTHAQVVSAKIGNKVFYKEGWNNLLVELISIIKQKTGLAGEVFAQRLNEFNIGAVAYPHISYPYDSELGISIPNKDAITCAKKLK